MNPSKYTLLCTSTLFLSACGSGGTAGTLDLFPMSVGAQWTFQVTDTLTSATGTKVQEVMEQTTYPDVAGDVFRLETVKDNGNVTISWQQVRDGEVVRFAEDVVRTGQPTFTERYLPYKLRVDRTLIAPGATRRQEYVEQTYDAMGTLINELGKNEDWSVEAVEPVTVPAGTFEAVVVRRVSNTTASDKRYWFVDGIGKVREEAANQTEELESYSLP